MNKLLWKCPVCEQELRVTGLDCAHCGTEIRGQFELGRLARVSTEDLHFIEIFVKNRGNAYRVAEELEIPYKDIRARLTDLIHAMGYDEDSEAREELEQLPERRQQILKEIESGKITPDQGIKLLQGEG